MGQGSPHTEQTCHPVAIIPNTPNEHGPGIPTLCPAWLGCCPPTALSVPGSPGSCDTSPHAPHRASAHRSHGERCRTVFSTKQLVTHDTCICPKIMYKYASQGFLMVIVIFYSSCPSNSYNGLALLFLTVLSQCDISSENGMSVRNPYAPPTPGGLVCLGCRGGSHLTLLFLSLRKVFGAQRLWDVCASGLTPSITLASSLWGSWGERTAPQRRASFRAGCVCSVSNGPGPS